MAFKVDINGNVQYTNREAGIKAHAEEYSFNIDSELFQQLTPEQQKLWRKEIEQAVVSGGHCGLELAKDKRYDEEPVSDDLEEVSKKYSSCIYLEEVLSDDDKEVLRGRLINTFKAGAEWQKSQGVTKEAVIGITPKEYFISISQSTVDMLDLCAGDKVIVQLRKKEDKI